MKEKPVSVAVIGCGRWGPNHVRNLMAQPGVRVAALVDADQVQLSKVAAMFPGLPAHRDAAAVFKDGAVDAVVISTPTSTHHALVKRALEAGKHVLCEKPLCETSRQAKELAALAKAKRRVLMVGHVFLFNGGVIKLKELVSGGELGKLHYLSAVRTNLGPIRSDVNASYDLAAHDVSVFNWLLGDKPESVSATGASFLQSGIEDVSFLSLRYAKGVYANIHASWLNPKKVRQAIVVGSQRMATWDDLDLSTPVAIYDKGAEVEPDYRDYSEFLRVSLWDGEVRLPKVTLEEPLKSQDRHFIEAVRTGRLDRSDAEFAVGVVETLEAADASMKAGGRPVRVGR